MENTAKVLDSTVSSLDSNKSKDSSNSDSKPNSCLESKDSKEILISKKQRRQQQHQPHSQEFPNDDHKLKGLEVKDDSHLLMFTSCGQLLFGVVLVVFGILVLVHGSSLGGSGAGLWAGAGALVAGALGVVATLATSTNKTNSTFSTAHLAASLIALALSNMAAIMALTAIVRDSQRTPNMTLVTIPTDDGNVAEVERGWASLLASIGLLVCSVAELLISGYSCLTLTPKLCGCLKSSTTDELVSDGRLKTRNMVHQWVIAQNHVPKNQPIYVIQPMLPVHPMIQSPYRMPPTPAKFPGRFVTAGPLSMPTVSYGTLSVLPHMSFIGRPPSQMIRSKLIRHSHMEHEEVVERKRQAEETAESMKRMALVGDDQVDLAQTYTGLDKKISEEFISIAMDPERKSKASSTYSSDIGTKKSF